MPEARQNRLFVAAAVLFLMVVVLAGWYAVVANYDYGALAGVYVLNHDGEKCILDLR